ncbi:phosphodiester glycosidase family protein [Streptomyces sp. MAR4 CNX-425]|uniref:phosphodiester glycosidase family protein n=1 Tax=Streptomyces sp. MAR4 CNX-425 TaxID=3406343 RepID=UPI003B503818
MDIASTSRPVAPGMELTSFERLETDKWLKADALSVDLGAGTRVDYLAGDVSDRAPVSELAAEHDPGPGRTTVAAINADFFDINETGAPLGPGVEEGRLTHSPAAGVSDAVGVGPDQAGRVLDLYFEGTLTLPDGEHPLGGHNAANVPADGIGVYDTRWGTADRALTVDGATEVTEVAVRDGRVTEVTEGPGKGAIPEGTTVLVGRDTGAKLLGRLVPGDRVGVEYDVRTDDGSPVPRTAVGGRGVLVEDGVPQDWEGRPNNTAAPRTAVGFSRDGGTMHVLTVDGRQADAGGVTLTELAKMMDALGAYDALNLDGGGSSTLVARAPGSDERFVENSPSDGHEREVPNGLAFTASGGSGKLRDFRVTTAADPALAPGVDPVPGGHPERVFPGLTRDLDAAGYDETYGPARGRPYWYTSRRGVGTVDGDGTFTARRGGTVKVTARRGHASGSTELTVLDRLDRITPTSERVGLADPRDETAFGIVGLDAHGASAPVDPADVRLDYDRALFDIDPDPRSGGFTVRAAGADPTASGVLKATVQGKVTHVALTVGLTEAELADFDDAADWKFSTARATGSLGPEPEGHTGTGMKITYDFSQSTATRAAYVTPPRAIEIPGQPLSFGLWIKGDGKGAWPSLHLKDGAGANLVLRGDYVTWQGWRKVIFQVPEGTQYPLSVFRFYLAEAKPASQYSSEVVIDELTAQSPPEVDLPRTPAHPDPLIDTAAETADRDWRYAVMSDAQFVARDPDSDLVRQARRTLREIRAARPDFVLINGDLVDEGSPEDLKFARTILEEELGDAVPWYYVPGNHEVMGGSVDNFVAEFGPAQRTFDHKGTRFLTLDTSSLTLRGGGYAQIAELKRQLEAAAEDPSVRSVTVVQHVPPRDPTPQRASQLGDRKEARVLEDWLADFRARTGKGAAFVGGHVGTFHAEHVDGVPYLINGNSGKAPATPPGEGGFSGWSLIGVDHVSRGEQHRARHRPHRGQPDWVSVQTRPHVDGLAVTAPEEVRAGRSAPASASVAQGARQVPVGWPVSADWSGTDRLHIGPPRQADRRDIAAYDPATGEVTGLRPGTVTLTVTVNGVTRGDRVTVTR